MKQIAKKAIILSASLLVIASSFGLILGGTKASADPSSKTPDPGLQVILDDQICPKLMKIPKQKVGGYCKSYIKQADLDTAYKKICSIYGANGNGKLKTECNAYKNYKPGSYKPKAATDPTTVQTCSKLDNCEDPAVKGCTGSSCDLIDKYVNPGINLMTLVFGFIAVISLIMGGIQYSASGGDPQAVSTAKKRISNTILAIVAYFFLYAFLQFIIPGGAFQ